MDSFLTYKYNCMKFNIVIILLFCSLSSCNHTPQRDLIPIMKSIQVIDTPDTLLNLSEISDSVSYLMLQIPKDYLNVGSQQELLKRNVYLGLTDKFAILFDGMKEGNPILVFDRKTGELVSEINPNKLNSFSSINSISIDGKILYFFSFNPKIRSWMLYEYDLFSKMIVDSIKRPFNSAGFTNTHYVYYYLNKKDKSVPRLEFFDYKAKKVTSRIKHSQSYPPNPFTLRFFGDIVIYQLENKANFFEISVDTVYQISNDSKHLYPKYYFNLGKYSAPYYFQTGEIMMPDMYYKVSHVMETNNYLFARCSYLDTVRYIFYDITNDNTRMLKGFSYNNADKTYGGIYDDIKLFKNIWPTGINNGKEIGCLLYIDKDDCKKIPDSIGCLNSNSEGNIFLYTVKLNKTK